MHCSVALALGHEKHAPLISQVNFEVVVDVEVEAMPQADKAITATTDKRIFMVFPT